MTERVGAVRDCSQKSQGYGTGQALIRSREVEELTRLLTDATIQVGHPVSKRNDAQSQ